jgi:hypothetical protein
MNIFAPDNLNVTLEEDNETIETQDLTENIKKTTVQVQAAKQV